jgi:hypothetical protein
MTFEFCITLRPAARTPPPILNSLELASPELEFKEQLPLRTSNWKALPAITAPAEVTAGKDLKTRSRSAK